MSLGESYAAAAGAIVDDFYESVMTLAKLNLKGTHFDIGVALGRFGQRSYQQFRQQSETWRSLQAYKTKPRFLAIARAVREQHPAYWDEIRGMALGLGVDEQELMLWNCRGDLHSHTPDGCTTIQWPGSPSIIAHNEDGDPRFRGACAMAQIAIDSSPTFTAFVYPGSLPGHTFAVTANGLAFTVNNLRGKHPGNGLPRMMAARALLDQPDLDSALKYLQTESFAGGFHLTIGQAGIAGLFSVEFHADRCSVVKQQSPSAHANHMIHPAMRDQPQRITASSQCRQELADELISQNGIVKPLSILWNRQDPQFPIFRTSDTDSDQENTLATVHMTIDKNQVDWQVYDAGHAEPCCRLANHRWLAQM